MTMTKFEVLVSDQYVVLKNGLSSLWWTRSASTPINSAHTSPSHHPSASSSSSAADNAAKIVTSDAATPPVPEFRLLQENDCKQCFAGFTCHGITYGLVGLFLVDKLVLIKQAHSVGRLPFGHKDEVFKVNKICVLSLRTRGEPLGDLGLDKCTQDSCTKPVVIPVPSPIITEPMIISASFGKQAVDNDNSGKEERSATLTITGSFSGQQGSSTSTSSFGSSGVQKTWNQIKLTASNVKPRVNLSGNSAGPNGSTSSNVNQPQDERDKYERRFIDELYKMFNETNSFYFSWTGDLTNSVQRQQKQKKQLQSKSLTDGVTDIRLIPLWKRVDDRFFWNKFMLKTLIETFDDVIPFATSPATQQAQTNVDEKLDKRTYSHIWILPIIQGFVQIEKCFFDLAKSSPVGSNVHYQKDSFSSSQQQPTLPSSTVPPSSGGSTLKNGQCQTSLVAEGAKAQASSQQLLTAASFLEGRDYYLMTLISRRSRFRAGTRYKKRGLDEQGRCANYVETEQIFTYGLHTVSFVLVRGSVPLFWSQLGHKYRPPPRLERSEAENLQAFRTHFEQEFVLYEGDTVAVSLVEHTGREKILADAFLDAAIKMDDSRLTYVSFDFHDYCRGMRFENVSILIDRIYEYLKDIRYCWIDADGMICEQRGVFRINCIDCLDRTNIVMTAIAKAVMDIQLVRLGLLPPEGQLPPNSRRIFQLMWAHNGDIISRQYAGTAALKGDYTRTGERKISGVVRDGYNSANRYYLNRFKDAYRQAVIDIMQGCPVADALSSPDNEKINSLSTTASAVALSKSISNNALSNSLTTTSLSSNDQEYHERIKLVIEDCKKILVPQEEVILGGWPLVDADPVTGTALSTTRVMNGELPESDMDIVLILTKDCYYVADYDDQTDRIIKYQKVLLEDLEKIELGAEPNYQSGPFGPIRGVTGSNNRIISYAVRFHYTIGDATGYFHMFRSTGTRFFNNMAIPIRTREEALESLKAICESFKVALSVKELNVPFHEVSRLERRKSKRLYPSSSFKLSNSNNSSNSHSNGGSVPPSGTEANPNQNGRFLESTTGATSRKLFTGMYSQLSRLRGKLTGSANSSTVVPLSISSSGSSSVRPTLQLDGIRLNNQPSATGALYEHSQEYESTDAFGQQMTHPTLSAVPNVQLPTATDEDDGDESDEDDSIFKLRKKRYRQSGCNTAVSSSSSLAVERTFSSDLSESDYEDSELLPPISEIGSPGDLDDDPLCPAKDNMDRVLESCGILVTSPPLRSHTPESPSQSGGRSSSQALRHGAEEDLDSKTKSVLADVDDFVLDSMKKASLRQIRRKAVSKSQVSLCSSTNSLHQTYTTSGQPNPRINVDPGSANAITDPPSRSSSRCIFSSELALNSIVSQSIKKDIALSKLSSSLSTDALDNTSNESVAVCNSDRPGLAYNLMSSSSFAALSSQANDCDFKSFDNSEYQSLNVLPESYLEQMDDDDSSLLITHSEQTSHSNRASLDHSALSITNPLFGIASKESSLSVSDLASGLGHSGLKMSRSSNALQSTCNLSGHMSLNLPSINSSSTLSISGDGDHHHGLCSGSGPGSTSLSGGGGGSGSSSNFTTSLMVKKDLVLSPLTRIAKGMQNLGLQLRNSTQGSGDQDNQQESAVQNAELQLRKQQTRSRIIEL